MNIKKSPTEENLPNILEVREESLEPAGKKQSKLSRLEQHHPRRETRLRYFSWLFIITLIYFSLLMGFLSMACAPSGGIVGGIILGIFFGIVILIGSPVSLIILLLSFITFIFIPKLNIHLIWRYGIIVSILGFIISFCIAFIFNFHNSCNVLHF